jgi:uncharacterized membrane protein
MYEIVKTTAQYVAYFAEGIAALIIVCGVIQAFIIYLKKAIFFRRDVVELMESRLKLGFSLSLGLGFLVAADIVKTAVAPTWDEIGQLAAIVAIRTVINYFLTRDMKYVENQE